MKKSVLVALLVALPVEVLNARPTFPIDIGLPDNASWLQQFLAAEWFILHLPGLRLTDFDPYFHYWSLDIAAVVLSGYLDTALLIFAAVWAYRGIRRLSRKGLAQQTSSDPKP
ncbi:MAG: hypothetical protein ABSA42_04880 [Terracidiphilus sp.]|jgi:hypothetical protein